MCLAMFDQMLVDVIFQHRDVKQLAFLLLYGLLLVVEVWRSCIKLRDSFFRLLSAVCFCLGDQPNH
jgi:hypothetical protein